MEVAVRGMVWLLPRSLNEVTAIVKEYSTKLGVVAVFACSAYWLLVRTHDDSGLSAPDVIGLLTKLALPGLVLWAVGVLLFRVVVARAGPPKSWPRRAVITASLAVGAGIASAAAADFTAKKLQPHEQQWLAHVDSNNPITFRIVTAFLLGAFL
jgi:multisubunit Na+/H+ antiporter MnhB subunit